MSWFWLNIPLGSVFIAATAGLPLWLVLRHPGGPAAISADLRDLDATPQSRPLIIPVTDAGLRVPVGAGHSV
jgi:hypothetical protein